MQLGPSANIVVTEYRVKLDIRSQEIGERGFEDLLDAPPDAVAVDVVAEQQYEVEPRAIAPVSQHFPDDTAQAGRDFPGVADDTKHDRRLSLSGRRGRRQHQDERRQTGRAKQCSPVHGAPFISVLRAPSTEQSADTQVRAPASVETP